MAAEIFIDTSGFYALLVRADERHGRARDAMRKAAKRRQRFITTDYILDETSTLLMARRCPSVIPALFEAVSASKACRIVWMDAERFERAKDLFIKNIANAWSFTDCFSFIVMRELRLREALSKDQHFRNAGFTPLLA
jgi:predicted nucleic acid-binding protein